MRVFQVISTFTSTPTAATLQNALGAAGIRAELNFVQYGQMSEYMLSPASESSEVLGSIVLVRVEDWLRSGLLSGAPASGLDAWVRQQLRNRLDEFILQFNTLAA